MQNQASPICAIATAAGRGGIGVVRLSFASAKELLIIMTALCGKVLKPRQATYLSFLNAEGSAIDRGIALYFEAPHSYTGEHVLELQGHGGPIVMQLLLARCLELGQARGLRLAEPGEFTRRAFENDKLDLAQAEAVADLIEASTEAAARSAARSLEGAFSTAVHALVEKIIHLRMLVEATLDFPEEEIDFLQAADAQGQLRRIQGQLATLLDQAKQGALLREGLRVVLVGAPNVGKSSLLNALAGAELAIVTPIAGTTRDRVEQTIQIEGIPLHIIDTAGLRETQDEIEKIGIARTWDAVRKADVILHLQCAQEGDTVDAELLQQLRAEGVVSVPYITVFNKIDLMHAMPRSTEDAVWLSAKQQQGIDLLRTRLLELAGWHSSGESLFLARERHVRALRAAQENLHQAQHHAAQNSQTLDLFAEELRLAQEQLNHITGEFTADDLLGEIFSRFCIGK